MPERAQQSGHTLVELMVSLLLAMLISIAAMYLFGGQMHTFYHHARKEQTSGETQAAFEAITTLLRQAEMCLSCATVQQIAITYPGGVANPNPVTTPYLASDSIDLDFTVPAGYAIWPNNTAPYTNNTIYLGWSQANGTVKLGSGTDAATAKAAAIDIAGSKGNLNTRIVNLDVWPLTTGGAGASAADKPNAGYHVVMTARVGAKDMSYTNPLDPQGPMQHYRTVTYEADILPRNW